MPVQARHRVLGLARELLSEESVNYFDLEDTASLPRLEEPMTALRPLRGLVVIDEVQRRPDLFPILRVLVDRRDSPARFLILGSASGDLLRQTSESLAGRMERVTMGGFTLEEVGIDAEQQLWLRGGFPLSYLAAGEKDSLAWRKNFVHDEAFFLGHPSGGRDRSHPAPRRQAAGDRMHACRRAAPDAFHPKCTSGLGIGAGHHSLSGSQALPHRRKWRGGALSGSCWAVVRHRVAFMTRGGHIPHRLSCRGRGEASAMNNSDAERATQTEPNQGKPTHSPEGIDLTLIRWMLSLTPEERLEVLQSTVQSIQRLRGETED